MEFSVPMALADFVPVVLFLIGAILLQRELYPRLGKGQFALFAAGTINVFCAGALKAVYKLLYALGVCDFTKLNEVFFPVQSIGFLLAGLAMAAFLFYKPKKTTICGVAAAPAVYSGTVLFVSLMVVGLGLLDAGLIALAVRAKKRGIVVLLVVLVCAAIAGGAYLVWQNAQIAKSAEEAATTPEPEAPTTSQDAADPRVENPIDFASLRLENPDIYAWIYIPGTDVNYPVVQHPTDDTFYLKHNKDGEWSEEGAIYTQLANKTDFSDPVTVIYGHNLVQGTMFTTLHRFENKDFFDSHEDMYLYTDGHILTYRVIAAYQYDNRHILNSFNFSDPTIVQQYFDSVLSPDSLVENVREGTTLTSSDKIVQLSTCTGDSNHIVRRYLVTGVLVSDQPTY